MWRKFLFLGAFFFLWPSGANAEEVDLQKLIDATPANGELTIQPGTYKGSFVIEKPMKIVGSQDVKLTGVTDKPIFTIQSTNEVQLEHLIFSNAKVGVLITDASAIQVKNVSFQENDSGMKVYRSNDLRMTDVTIQGTSGHYSKKGNGISFYDSSDYIVENANIESVQDGLYIENSKNVELLNNRIQNSRYGIHFMYSEQARAAHNKFSHNVTGIMLMMTKNTVLEDNEVEKHQELNSIGFVLFDAQQIQVKNNDFRENRIAISLQKLAQSTMEHNTLSMNQTAVEIVKSNKENTITSNAFLGNILNIRSDQTESTIQGNYYDDYEGNDFNGDGVGDTPYSAMQSFGQWMVRKPVYQYFIESPSVVLLNQMDRQTNRSAQNQLVDTKPSMNSAMVISTSHERSVGQAIVGAILLLSVLVIWRKGALR